MGLSVEVMLCLRMYVCMSIQIVLFQQFPQLRGCVRPAVEKAVQELLMPVVDRSIKIALTTTEHIIKKVAMQPSTLCDRVLSDVIVKRKTILPMYVDTPCVV